MTPYRRIMRRREYLSSVAGLGIATLSGCFGDGNGENGENEDDDPEEGDRVEIIESELVRDNEGTEEESVAVEGIVEIRPGEEEVSYVEIQARFLDDEGEQLDSIIEQIDEIARHGEESADREGRRWEFEILFPHTGEHAAEVESYELEIGTEL